MVAYRGKTNGATIRQSATIRCSGTIATIARPIVVGILPLYRMTSFDVHYSRWAYIVRVCDTARYPHYVDLAHYMISGLYSAGTRTIRD